MCIKYNIYYIKHYLTCSLCLSQLSLFIAIKAIDGFLLEQTLNEACLICFCNWFITLEGNGFIAESCQQQMSFSNCVKQWRNYDMTRELILKINMASASLYPCFPNSMHARYVSGCCVLQRSNADEGEITRKWKTQLPEEAENQAFLNNYITSFIQGSN